MQRMLCSVVTFEVSCKGFRTVLYSGLHLLKMSLLVAAGAIALTAVLAHGKMCWPVARLCDACGLELLHQQKIRHLFDFQHETVKANYKLSLNSTFLVVKRKTKGLTRRF